VEHIGIDVHKRESQLYIINGATGEVTEQRIRTERGRFKDVLGGRAKAKVLLEASTESEWVARCIEELGHEVVVADPNFATRTSISRKGATKPTPGRQTTARRRVRQSPVTSVRPGRR
jgi:transposase